MQEPFFKFIFENNLNWAFLQISNPITMKTFNIQIILMVTILVLLSSACEKDIIGIKGSGPIVSQNFNLPPITGIQLSIDGNVSITEGDTQMVKIEAQQNIIDNIRKTVSGGKWNIEYINPVNSHDGITIYITTPSIYSVTISGSGNIASGNTFTDSTNVSLQISGSGNVTMGLLADRIESTISGSGNVHLIGKANEHKIIISGSGNVAAFGLETSKTDVTISSSGNSEVFANDNLNVIISGSGNVFYIGYPAINVAISGSGALINSNK